jgi:hypothetical protein
MPPVSLQKPPPGSYLALTEPRLQPHNISSPYRGIPLQDAFAFNICNQNLSYVQDDSPISSISITPPYCSMGKVGVSKTQFIETIVIFTDFNERSCLQYIRYFIRSAYIHSYIHTEAYIHKCLRT